MESRAKLLGHPIHQMLIVLPLGLFVSAVVFDALFLARGLPVLALASYWNIALGIVGGLLAAVFGFIDWLAIPRATRARRIGLLHGSVNVLVVAAFATAWLMRRGTIDLAPATNVFLLEVAGLLLGTVGGWLGGELVDRLGIGVTEGANVNAPSSLSSQPVRRIESQYKGRAS